MLHNISSTTADAPSMTIQGHSVEKIGSASRNPSYLKLTGLEAALFCAPHASPSTRLGSDLHPAQLGQPRLAPVRQSCPAELSPPVFDAPKCRTATAPVPAIPTQQPQSLPCRQRANVVRSFAHDARNERGTHCSGSLAISRRSKTSFQIRLPWPAGFARRSPARSEMCPCHASTVSRT